MVKDFLSGIGETKKKKRKLSPEHLAALANGRKKAADRRKAQEAANG